MPSLRWDTDTAAATLVMAALVFLWLARRGFRGAIS